MSPANRLDKVNALLQAVVSRQLARLQTPGALATVTSVETSPDLREATVWISLLPEKAEAWQTVAAYLEELQQAVAAEATMKYTPKLQLRQDRGTAHAQHIEELIQDLRRD